MALYSGRFWPVSAALVAKAMGATIAGLCSRGSSFTTASAQRTSGVRQRKTICSAVAARIRDGGRTEGGRTAATNEAVSSSMGTRRISIQEQQVDVSVMYGALAELSQSPQAAAEPEEVRACRLALTRLIGGGRESSSAITDGSAASMVNKLARLKRKASILHGWNDDGARATKDRPSKEFPNRPSSSGRTSSIASGHRRTSSASSSTDPAPLSQADHETSAHAASAEARGSGVGTTLRYPAPEAGEDRPPALTAEPEAVYRVCMTWRTSGECGGAVISETNAASMGAGAGAGATLRDPRQGRIGIPRRLPRPGPHTVHV